MIRASIHGGVLFVLYGVYLDTYEPAHEVRFEALAPVFEVEYDAFKSGFNNIEEIYVPLECVS